MGYCRLHADVSTMLLSRERTMKIHQTRREFSKLALATITASAFPAPYVWAAEKKYDSGASDTEIKIGQTVPHSGPGSLYGVLGRVGEAYFQMLNEQGGINGRKIKFLTMDDAYSAPKCVEATRRLVEQEEVLALYGSLGTAPQTAVHKYLNSKGVPQLLLNTGASKWNDPKNFKWTMAGLPLYPTEARILAKHVLSVKPEAKIGILYQNDDFGRDFLGPFKKVLADAGGKAQVIMEQTYDLTDPTVDSQLINLSKSGADVFYNISTGKASSQSIRKVAELGWNPLQLLSAGSTGRSILSAAGFENAKGIVAIRYAKDAGVPRWEKDPEVMAFEDLRKKYLPNVDPDNTIAFAGYGQAVTMGEILRRCGDDLRRENVLNQAANLNGFHSPFFLDGVTYSYKPDDYTPMRTLYISIFNGKDWDISDRPVTE
jgi:ABC-type branched-subunit amino acid transport system substrate-binding protein